MRPSQCANIDPFLVMQVLKQADLRTRSGKPTWHLQVGQPGFCVPDAALHALSDTPCSLGYSPARGRPELVARLQRHYAAQYDLTITQDAFFITAGSSAAFVLAFLAGFDKGAKIAIPTPGYPCYRNIINGLGMHSVLFATDHVYNFQPTLDAIECTHKTHGLQGLIIASPNNPTSTMINGSQFRAIAEFCDAEGILLISDEIYHGICFDKTPDCAHAFSENAIIINSFSKYYAMTGWRVGWMIVPQYLQDTVERLAENFFICAPVPGQIVAEHAFDCQTELQEYCAEYRINRNFLIKNLPEIGISEFCHPDGGFYLYANIAHLSDNAPDFCQQCLQECGVAITPGNDFDPVHGHQFIRFSYARENTHITQALQVFADWVKITHGSFCT
ncbi:MAG: aminotransferase class I/II-fold pyridoxal phosphate-dependent enzyme [Pseudomonadota bacterium]